MEDYVITLEFTDGDDCDEGKHESGITLICDKYADSLAQIEYVKEESSGILKNLICRMLSSIYLENSKCMLPVQARRYYSISGIDVCNN